MRHPVPNKPGYPFGAIPYPLLIKNPDGTTFGWKHGGQDYPCDVGTPVVAPHAGTVIFAGSNGSAGNEVRIASGGMQTRLLHNSVIKARVGQVVNEGDVVSFSGNTGFTTGPHVHWYLSINGKYVNPIEYVTPPPVPAKKRIYLPASEPTWRIYPLGVPLRVGNEKGFLRPQKYGGLDYEILNYVPGGVTIATVYFGIGNIWSGSPAVIK